MEARYLGSLASACNWLLASERRSGGSAAHWMPVRGWSRAYPETTGYIIPTLIEAGELLGDPRLGEAALRMGEWLLSIQSGEGWWPAGLHPPRGEGQPSIFNTGQILQGMEALARRTREAKWAEAGARGAGWLAAGVDDSGQWREGHYRPGFQPTYYTRVAWPMLQVAALTGEAAVREAAVRVLDFSLGQALPNGAFAGWGFAPGQPAFTHTIAYTIEGFLGAAALLGGDGARFREGVRPAIDRLYRQAELSHGRLPGRYDEDWTPDRSFVCVTGAAQTAICLLQFDRFEPDLRLVDAAAKLADSDIAIQARTRAGGIPGSAPLWGPYMRGRHPNWAAKFHADSLMLLIARLRAAGGASCASS